ncbi:MAG TPA: ABC transporter permease [Candidatus Marinimicrobia bacterium]|jgi:ABC-type lipoprotein release transport system permease subunit|nr:ABC transporter permease [Candidatus Neomarinimicrobiota bacterium]
MNIVFLIAKRFLISRNLFQGGMINIVSFLGLFIGAASIVLSIAVLNGFQNVLGDETKKLYGDYIFLDTNEDFVRNIDSDFKYSPFSEEEFFLLKGNKQSLIKLKTVFTDQIDNFYDLDRLNSNSLGNSDIIIGKSLAEKMSISIGDSISIYDTNLAVNNVTIIPHKKLFVKDIYNNRILRSDEFLVFNSFDKNNLPNEFTGIEILGNIESLSGKYSEDKLISWKDRNKQLFDATEIEKKITFFTLFLIIIVASFNLSSSIVQISTKKTREMAILNAFGMTERKISMVFLTYGYLLSLTAIIGGVLLSSLFIILQNQFGFIMLNPEFYLVEKLPMKIGFKEISLLISFSIIIVGIFASLPLMIMKKINPIILINKNI